MKKLMKAVALVAVFAVALSPMAFAASASTSPFQTKMVVASTLTLSANVTRQPDGATNLTAMDFGTLADSGFSQLRSSKHFVVYLSANSQTLPYIISQTGTALSNGTTTIPTAALKVTPVYATADNGGLALPTGAALGTAGTWVATNKTLYDSENANAAMRVIQAIYGVEDGIALNQPAGNYTGTVTFTVTTA